MSPKKEYLAPFVNLIRDFTENKLTGTQFETEYNKLFMNDQSPTTDREFEILDGLFADVDDYTSDPELRARVGGLDDDELRARAKRRLDQLVRQPPFAS